MKPLTWAKALLSNEKEESTVRGLIILILGVAAKIGVVVVLAVGSAAPRHRGRCHTFLVVAVVVVVADTLNRNP